MTEIESGSGDTADAPRRSVTLVWIDSREAILVRLADGSPVLERVESDVPAHHRATGHVRHDPGVRHGGGGQPQTADEPRRLEHLDRFVEVVSLRLRANDDLALIGPGTVREHLEKRVRADDVRHRRRRTITCEPSDRLTDRQLVARLRDLAGFEARRRTVGAYRWSEPPDGRRGRMPALPRRMVEKGPGQPESE